jgi:hypothetical protein
MFREMRFGGSWRISSRIIAGDVVSVLHIRHGAQDTLQPGE